MSGFSGLVEAIKVVGYNKDIEVVFGTVTSLSPFKVKVQGLTLDSKDILVVNSLLKHKRKYKVINPPAIKSTGSCSTGYNVQPTDASYLYEVEFEGILQVKDKVLLLQEGDTFFLLDKVVRP